MDAVKKNKNVKQKYDDPELEAEAQYAREKKGSSSGQRKMLPPDSVRKITEAFVNGTGDKVLPPKVLKTGKADRKARSRGVSGCSTKKDGGRFEYGLDCIDLAYDDIIDDVVTSDSEAEYDEYADYVFQYSDEEIRSVVQDYLLNGAKEEALNSLEKFRITADATFRMLKDLIQLSLEAADGGGINLGIKLIEAIQSNGWLPACAVPNAVEEIVDTLAELKIDSPKAVEAMSVFIAKLVDDGILTREVVNLMAAKHNKPNSEKARVIASQCFNDALTYADNHTLLVGKCVPSGGHQSVEVLSAQFRMILREFLISNDKDVVCSRVNELKVPHFNHNFVYQACVLALERMDKGVMARLTELLKKMYDNGLVAESCLQKGYEKMYDSLSDLFLDLPAAYTLARRWVDISLEANFLSKEIAAKCPTRARSRTVSEGPDGKLVCDAEEPENSIENDENDSVTVMHNGPITNGKVTDVTAAGDVNAQRPISVTGGQF